MGAQLGTWGAAGYCGALCVPRLLGEDVPGLKRSLRAYGALWGSWGSYRFLDGKY